MRIVGVQRVEDKLTSRMHRGQSPSYNILTSQGSSSPPFSERLAASSCGCITVESVLALCVVIPEGGQMNDCNDSGRHFVTQLCGTSGLQCREIQSGQVIAHDAEAAQITYSTIKSGVPWYIQYATFSPILCEE